MWDPVLRESQVLKFPDTPYPRHLKVTPLDSDWLSYQFFPSKAATQGPAFSFLDLFQNTLFFPGC